MAKKKQPRADGRFQGKILVGIVDGKQKYRYVYGATQKEVNQKLADLKVQLNKGVDLLQDRGFLFWADRWKKKAEAEHTPEWGKQLVYRAGFWRDRIGNREISKITPADLEEILFDLAACNPRTGNPSSKKTLVEYKNVINGIFEYAVQNRVISFNPAAYLTVSDAAPKSRRLALTDEQIALIRSTAHEAQLPAMLMLYAGLRLGEVCALTWRNVNLQQRTIEVNRALNFRSGATKSPKTAAGTRTVPIPQILYEYLSVVGNKALLVCTHNGAAYTIGAWNKTWERYCEALGFKTTAHCLRHTYCTLLFEAGVDVLTAKELMGHADVATTMKIYTHLRDRQKTRSISKLDDYLSGNSAPENTVSAAQF